MTHNCVILQLRGFQKQITNNHTLVLKVLTDNIKYAVLLAAGIVDKWCISRHVNVLPLFALSAHICTYGADAANTIWQTIYSVAVFLQELGAVRNKSVYFTCKRHNLKETFCERVISSRKNISC